MIWYGAGEVLGNFLKQQLMNPLIQPKWEVFNWFQGENNMIGNSFDLKSVGNC